VNADTIARMPAAELHALLRDGHPVEPRDLAGSSFLGRSLNLPAIVEKLTWTWFRKELVAEADGRVRGWNVRVEQDHPHRPRRKRGEPWTFGHFEVAPLCPGECPAPVGEGVLLDYGRGDNPALDLTRMVRDPVVAVDRGSADLLLGWTYLRVLGRSVGTPSFFVLQKDGRTEHVPSNRHQRSSDRPR
jgi:hypothetical protein